MLPPVVALPISETLGRPVANHLRLFSSQHWFLGSAGRRLAGVFHQLANLFIVFDDGSHVMVERHAHGKPVALHDRLEHRRLTGELSAQSGAGISRLFRLAAARRKRRIAAELRTAPPLNNG